MTKLDRDPASGTALQEISFWLNLERALLRIQEKRESPEITLTLEILKHGKRFHATVSFDTDTGLHCFLVGQHSRFIVIIFMRHIYYFTFYKSNFLTKKNWYFEVKKYHRSSWTFAKSTSAIQGLLYDYDIGKSYKAIILVKGYIQVLDVFSL